MSDAAETVSTCYRHTDRRAGVRCQRCERPICPNCMISASVGFHCPDCARAGRQKVLTAQNLRARPIMTPLLIAANVAMFVFQIAKAGGGNGVSSGGSTLDLVNAGALFAPAIDINHEWWRLVSAAFLHIGIIHLGLNMVALWFLGSQLEPAMGKVRFTVLYFVSMLAGSFGVLLLSPNEVTAGASGAIFGLLGAALAYQRVHRIDIWASGLGGVLLINLAITFGIRGISIGGHIGGLVGGFLVGWLFFGYGREHKDQVLPIVLSCLLGAACFAGGLWAATQWSLPPGVGR